MAFGYEFVCFKFNNIICTIISVYGVKKEKETTSSEYLSSTEAS